MTTYHVTVDYLTRYNTGTFRTKVEADSEAAAIDLAICTCKLLRNPIKITSTSAYAKPVYQGEGRKGRGAYR